MWLLTASEICPVSIVIKHQLVLFFHKYCYMISEDEDRFASDVVTSILKAMQYGSKDARQLFPCLLQLRGLTHLSELFHKEASIMWIKLISSIINSTLLRIFMDSCKHEQRSIWKIENLFTLIAVVVSNTYFLFLVKAA